jgi:hypothetical protein
MSSDQYGGIVVLLMMGIFGNVCTGVACADYLRDILSELKRKGSATAADDERRK